MVNRENQWPIYATPYQALGIETNNWGGRLASAERRYEALDGELPPSLHDLVISIVDGDTESPDTFSLLDTYGQRADLDPDSFGVLLYVNYEGDVPSSNTHNLVDVIQGQRERSRIPVTTALAGYDQRRRFDWLRGDVWDVAVVHALRSKIDHPVIGISNDADMKGLSSDYVRAMTENGYVDESAMIWGSEIAYTQPGGPDLPLHKIVAYLHGNRRLRGDILVAHPS